MTESNSMAEEQKISGLKALLCLGLMFGVFMVGTRATRRIGNGEAIGLEKMIGWGGLLLCLYIWVGCTRPRFRSHSRASQKKRKTPEIELAKKTKATKASGETTLATLKELGDLISHNNIQKISNSTPAEKNIFLEKIGQLTFKLPVEVRSRMVTLTGRCRTGMWTEAWSLVALKSHVETNVNRENFFYSKTCFIEQVKDGDTNEYEIVLQWPNLGVSEQGGAFDNYQNPREFIKKLVQEIQQEHQVQKTVEDDFGAETQKIANQM